jgi:DNA-damage-inducible protein J
MADDLFASNARTGADRASPFELKVPNKATREAMAEAEEIIRSGRARFSSADELFADLEKNTGR